MKEIILEHTLKDGSRLTATFLPDYGMNLSSLKKDDIEVIDQSTKNLFDERLSGLGPLIGPHFHHRKESEIPIVADETIFPHLKAVRKSGSKEPFSHGIARYVPWNYECTKTSLSSHLSGMDTYREITLASLEGFDFLMTFKANLTDNGLEIEMHTDSMIKPSIAGLHYYLALGLGPYSVKMKCQKQYGDKGILRDIPERWMDENGDLNLDLKESIDYTFRPSLQNFTGKAYLETQTHTVEIEYKTLNDENAFQIYHPEGASFVCIEPVTAKNPRDMRQKKNSLSVLFNIIN
jgi:hypothetical protein